MFPFRTKLLGLLPRWAKNLPGSQVWAVSSSFGQELDRIAFLGKKALEQRFTSKQLPERLVATGIWTKTPRYALDTEETYRERLQQVFQRYRLLGTAKGIEDECAYLGFSVVVFNTIDFLEQPWDQAASIWDNSAHWWDASKPPAPEEDWEWWNSFWIEVTLSQSVTDRTWDRASGTWDEASRSWDAFPVSAQEMATLIKISRRWRASYLRFMGIIFRYEADLSFALYQTSEKERY